MKKLIGIFAAICLTIILAAEIELPRVEEGEVVISHVGYTLSYNETHEQANWVAYELTAEEVAGEVERKDAFRADPEVESGSAALADYRSSGYDRGHLATCGRYEMVSGSDVGIILYVEHEPSEAGV